MIHNLDLLRTLGAWSIEGFWMPLLAWTMLIGLVWCCLRLWRSSPPLVSYAVLTSLLLALPLGVLLSLVTDVSLMAVWTPTASSITLPAMPPALAPPMPIAETAASGFSWTLLHSLGVLVLSAGLMAGVAFFRLSMHSYRLAHLRRHLPATPVPMEARQILDQQIATLGLQVPVRLVVTSHDVVPLTFGWRRPVIVMPASLLDDAEALRLTLLHELVHIRRGDYLMQWIGNVIGALFAIHPVVWLLRREIEGYRELACDAAVLGQPHISSKRYAALLYQFALVRSDPPQLALSMAASHRELKNRITAMKSFKATVYRFPPRLVAMTLASLLMGLTTFVVACTDFVGPDPEAETTAAKLDNAEVFVVVEELPELIGGLEAIQQDLQYPKIAKMAGIEGRVLIEFTVDAQGKVVNPKVIRGIGAGCDEEALRALQVATFKPGIQDGKAVPVKMSIPVTFRLNDDNTSLPKQESSFGVMQKQTARLKTEGDSRTWDNIKAMFEKSTPPPPNADDHTDQTLTASSVTIVKGSTILRQNTVNLELMKAAPHYARKMRVYVNGQLLKEGTDYTVDLQEGTLSIINPNNLNDSDILHLEFDD